MTVLLLLSQVQEIVAWESLLVATRQVGGCRDDAETSARGLCSQPDFEVERRRAQSWNLELSDAASTARGLCPKLEFEIG